MASRYAAFAAVLGIIIGGTALVGGFSGPGAWQGIGFIVLAVGGVGAAEYYYRRSDAPEQPTFIVDGAPEPNPSDVTFSGLHTVDSGLPVVRPMTVDPPDQGPYMGVALGTLGDARKLEPLLAAGTALPTRIKMSVSTEHGDQQSLEVTLHTSTGAAGARASQLCALVIHGIPPAKAGVPQVRLLVAVNELGQVLCKARIAPSRAELPIEIVGGAPSVPVARNRP